MDTGESNNSLLGPHFGPLLTHFGKEKCLSFLGNQVSFYLDSCKTGSIPKMRDQVRTLHKKENGGGVRGRLWVRAVKDQFWSSVRSQPCL